MVHRCSEQNSTFKNFCCPGKVVTMATNANLLNSVNLPSLIMKYCHKISFASFDLKYLSSSLR